MKEDGRKLSEEQQVGARRRAMLLLGKRWHERDIAEAVGDHERTVRQWKQHQRDHGTEALLRDERGRQHGEGRKLTAGQEKQVRGLITDKLPEQLKLSFALWTRKAVVELLEQQFGLKLPVRSMKGRRVYLILDNLRVHHSEPVKAWLEEYQEVIAVYHLPGYSPELNPEGRLNRSLKSTLSHLPSAKEERSLQKNHRQADLLPEAA
jgi:transposase